MDPDGDLDRDPYHHSKSSESCAGPLATMRMRGDLQGDWGEGAITFKLLRPPFGHGNSIP